MSIVEHSSQPWAPGAAGRGSRIQFVADPTGAVSGLALQNQECDPGVGIPSHTHEFEEVVTVLEGTAEVWLDARREVVGPGTSVFIPTGAVHGLVNVGTEPLKLQFVIASNRMRATFRA